MRKYRKHITVFISLIFICFENMGKCQSTTVNPTITVNPIAGSAFCAGSNLKINFTIIGTFNPGNTFTAQLSDANGHFSNPNVIGKLPGAASGPISAEIPATLVYGTGYVIRVISSNPIDSISKSSTFTINPLPASKVIPSQNICSGMKIYIGADSVPGNTYSWKSSPAGYTSTLSNPDFAPIPTTTYRLTEKDKKTGCSQSNSVTLTIDPGNNRITNKSVTKGEALKIGEPGISTHKYNWVSFPAGFVSNSADTTIYPSVSTIYTLMETITDTSNKAACSMADIISVNVLGATSNLAIPTAGKFVLAKKIPVYQKGDTSVLFNIQSDTSLLEISHNFISVVLMGHIMDGSNHTVNAKKVAAAAEKAAKRADTAANVAAAHVDSTNSTVDDNIAAKADIAAMDSETVARNAKWAAKAAKESIRFPVTNILKMSCYIDDLVRGYVPGTRRDMHGSSKFETLQFMVEDQQYFIYYKDIISYQPDLTNAKYSLNIVDTTIRILPGRPVAVSEAKHTDMNISFVGTGNLQQAIGFGDNGQIPATAGLGVLFDQTYHDQPSVFFPHRWPRLARLEGQVSVNVASSLDTIIVKETGDYLSRNNFGAFLLSPISSGQSATGSLRLYFARKPYYGTSSVFNILPTIDGSDVEFTASTRDWAYSDTIPSTTPRPSTKPYTIEVTGLAFKFGLFHEFVSPDQIENYSISVGAAFIDRYLVSNINQTSSNSNSSGRFADSIRYLMLYGSPYSFEKLYPYNNGKFIPSPTNGNFGGWEFYIRLKLVNLKADIELTNLYTDPIFYKPFSGHIISDGQPVAGLSDAQFIVRLSYVGGFPLQLHPPSTTQTTPSGSKPTSGG